MDVFLRQSCCRFAVNVFRMRRKTATKLLNVSADLNVFRMFFMFYGLIAILMQMQIQNFTDFFKLPIINLSFCNLLLIALKRIKMTHFAWSGQKALKSE